MKKDSEKLLSVDEYLGLDKENLKLNLSNLLKRLEKDSNRMVKILKQSDKQQLKILELYDNLEESNSKLEELHDYDVQQQQTAYKKVMSGAINELEDDVDFDTQTIFVPSDILSGDFYSIFKKPNGNIIFYVIDGQGHGISPSLTVFATSSLISRYVKEDISLQELMDKILPYLRNFLADEEQLSYLIVELTSDLKQLSYSSGGMYPALLKDGDEVVKLKANTLPMMNFSKKQDVKTIEINDFKNIILYSDGLVEIEDEKLLDFAPIKLLNKDSDYDKARAMIPSYTRDDDITVVSIEKK